MSSIMIASGSIVGNKFSYSMLESENKIVYKYKMQECMIGVGCV